MTAIEHVTQNDLVPSEQRRLNALWRQAQRLALSSVVPDALKNKPNDVLAVCLYGEQFGLAPGHALAQVHVISGRIVPSAQLMAGLAMRAGHRVRFKEYSSERATVAMRRREDEGDPEGWQVFTYTIEDARTAGLTNKDVWKKHASAMLAHRATSRAVRHVCPDVLLGIDDGGDEGMAIEDVAPQLSGDGVEASPSGQPAPSPEPIQWVGQGVPPGPGLLPSESSGTDVTLSDEPISDGGDLCESTLSKGHDAPPSEPITEPQNRKLHALMGHRGILGNARHPFVSERLGRKVTTLGDLRKHEAIVLIDWLEAAEQEGAPT